MIDKTVKKQKRRDAVTSFFVPFVKRERGGGGCADREKFFYEIKNALCYNLKPPLPKRDGYAFTGWEENK